MLRYFWPLNALIANVLQVLVAETIYFIFGQQALSNYIRKLTSPARILQYYGVQIGAGTLIYPGITINCANRKKFKHLIIGKHVRILWDVIIDLNDDVIIEDYAHIGTRSILVTHFNLGKSPLGITEYPYEKGKIKVGNGSVVSWGSTVLHDSEIGEHTIISSGSTIKGNVPSFCVFGGNPARPIKKIEPKNVSEFEQE
jgi:acetyltransferase-like isoleucine patch superfamily enzyme